MSDNETVSILTCNLSDDKNKSNVDDAISKEASLDFHVQFSETETQEFPEKNSREDELVRNSVLKKELVDLITDGDNEVNKTSNQCLSETVNVESLNSGIEYSNNYDCNEGKSLSDLLYVETTLKEVITNPSNSVSSEIAAKDTLSEFVNSSEKELNDVKSTIHGSGSLRESSNKNDDSYILNLSNRLNPDILSEVKLNKVPKLSGQPDEVIDLEKSPEKTGPVKLISRFMKHVTLKPKIKLQGNVIVAISEVNENGEIVNLKEETLKITKKEETLKLNIGGNSKPGETRMKLKATLQHKIAQCREKQFAKRMEEFKLNEEEMYGDEKLTDDEEENEKLTDDEEENEKLTDDEEENEKLTATESESDSEIEDVLIKDDIKGKNPFIDEEAEESENDQETLKKHMSSDSGEYSDPPSIDVSSLVDKDEEFPNLGMDMEFANSQRTNGLMALCSGDFTSQPLNINELEKNDVSFSQFEMNAKSAALYISNTGDEIPATYEDSEEEIAIIKKKKPKLSFSDDEDDEIVNSPDESGDSEEENQISIEYGNETEELINDDETEYAPVSKKDAKRFLEAEAELSGSDWGSADEDEIDLDCMEKEEGDEDVINQRKVRSELEKIHMKEMLDEDKREIRALQELFLEDGELHSDGPKRQRQFRWYNQDSENENGSFLCNLDGELRDGVQEEEEDESWRKMRLERENFLRNQKAEDLKISGSENTKFLKFAKNTGKKPLLKPSPFMTPDPRKQFSAVSRRGSFLSRGEKLLSKLAELTNISSDNPIGNTRGRRNMVFAVVSPPKEESNETSLKRRSTCDLSMNLPKKLKFSSPPPHKSQGGLFEKLKMVD